MFEFNKGKRWYWLILSNNVPIEVVEAYPNKPWVWKQNRLSRNKSIAFEFVEKFKDKDWHWGEYGLSMNPSITSDLVKKFKNEPWNWDTLYGNIGITENDI